MSLGLRALNRIAGLELLDRIGMRERAERVLYSATKNGFRAAGAAARTFNGSGPKLDKPARQARGTRAALFDLTPTDEQQMMREAIGDFAIEKLRPAALDADKDCAAPAELLEQANELGVTMLGIPGELDGAFEERSAITSVLVAEQLARGDMGLATAILAPASVATAIGLWGDADQQSTYLPEFAGEKPPAAALALLEPRPLFDPFTLETKAKRKGDGFVLDGVKSLVPRAADAELFVDRGGARGSRPRALHRRGEGRPGIAYAAEPAMGIRAAGTGDAHAQRRRGRRRLPLADADPQAYADCVRLGRLGWCALAIGTGQAAARLHEAVRQRARRLRRADLPPPGRGLQRRQHGDRARGHAAGDAAAPRAARTRVSTTPARSPWRASSAPKKGMQIGSDAVQLLGGHGYTKEHPVERWYRDLRAAGFMEERCWYEQ